MWNAPETVLRMIDVCNYEVVIILWNCVSVWSGIQLSNYFLIYIFYSYFHLFYFFFTFIFNILLVTCYILYPYVHGAVSPGWEWSKLYTFTNSSIANFFFFIVLSPCNQYQDFSLVIFFSTALSLVRCWAADVACKVLRGKCCAYL